MPEQILVAEFTIPLTGVELISGNARMPWGKKHRLASEQRQLARRVTRSELFPVMLGGRLVVQFPVAVSFTLVRGSGQKMLDSDNAVTALKAARDGVADALGADDSAKHLTCTYTQERGDKPELRIRVEQPA